MFGAMTEQFPEYQDDIEKEVETPGLLAMLAESWQARIQEDRGEYSPRALEKQ